MIFLSSLRNREVHFWVPSWNATIFLAWNGLKVLSDFSFSCRGDFWSLIFHSSPCFPHVGWWFSYFRDSNPQQDKPVREDWTSDHSVIFILETTGNGFVFTFLGVARMCGSPVCLLVYKPYQLVLWTYHKRTFGIQQIGVINPAT